MMETPSLKPSTDDAEPGDTNAHRMAYHQAIEFSLDSHLVSDAHGIILEANQATSTLMQCRKTFLIGKPLGLFVTQGHRTRFYECLARLHAGAGSDEFVTRLGRGDEARDVEVRVSSSPATSAGHAHIRWLIRDVTEHRRAEAARDDLMRRLVSAQEDERRRVARELHDVLGQELTALILGLNSLERALPEDTPGRDRLQEIKRIVNRIGREAHDLAVDLRPTALDDLGLRPALAAYVARWSDRTGVAAEFQPLGRSERFSLEAETTVYRVVQEALNNIAKHADARHVSVILDQGAGEVIALVEDDGRGFDPDHCGSPGRTSLGLLGMRERVGLVGGTLVIESAEGQGTMIRARIPIIRSSGGKDDGA